MLYRPALILVLLVLAPAPAAAQEPPETAATQRTHVVAEGETLAGIARDLLGDVARWREIFDANADVISDPDRIAPGMELTIPGDVAVVDSRDAEGVEVIRGRPDSTLVEVTGVQLRGELSDAGPLPEVVIPDDRRQLLRTRPFVPQETPPMTGERTVFYGSSEEAAGGEEGPRVIVQGASETLAVPPSAFHSAAWLVAEEEAAMSLGRVAAFAGGEDGRIRGTTLQPYDRVRVEPTAGGSFAPGDRLLAFHQADELERFRVMAPTAVLEVLELDGGVAVASVITNFGRAEIGDHVREMRTFPLSPGVHPESTDMQVEADLLGFRYRKELHLPGDEAFIDRGRAAGLAVGDQLVARTAGERGGGVAARLQVVGVQEEVATVRLISAQAPSALRAGLRVVLDRKMP